MNRIELLGSFLEGWEGANASEIINGIYVAKTIFDIDFRFSFKDKGSLGVDSSEIRRLIFFNKIKRKKKQDKPFTVAKQLSEIEPKKLAWVAQYLMNGQTHLYKEEAREALKTKKVISEIKL